MYTHPAVLIGGPPHSGKSVLLHALSQALRRAAVDHYALRSCPDGEGDFSQEATPDTVRAIRIKGEWTPEWVDTICRDIRNRHLPLLVDVGGRPTLDQERIFDACTHAILLTKDEASHNEWCDRVGRHGLPLLADLTSRQDEPSVVLDANPPLRAVVSDLNRNQSITNPVVDRLTSLLARLFATDQADLRRHHLSMAPPDVELVIDLERLAVTLGWVLPNEKLTWLPEHVPPLIDYLPAATPLAIYGRGTNWIHAGLARLAFPAAYHSFDVRLGWVQAVSLPRAEAHSAPSPLVLRIHAAADYLHLEYSLNGGYLDIVERDEIVAPAIPSSKGVILSGKVPYWLTTSLAITYADAPWLAVYQPQLQGAVVVHSTVRSPTLGQRLPIAASLG